jgi:flagellar biosynthesis/type III secretory pathway ATPase
MQELLRATDPTLIAFATVLLAGEDITVFAMDVNMSILDGSIGHWHRNLGMRMTA